MRKLNPYMNNGRWLLDCPQCSTPLPARESGVVCPRCYPDMLAKALKPLANGTFRPVADVELIGETLTKARRLKEEYFPAFPPEREQIERILRLRPAPKFMNWQPGETLEILRQQNIEHGDPVPEES
jgi:hypothetical protein